MACLSISSLFICSTSGCDIQDIKYRGEKQADLKQSTRSQCKRAFRIGGWTWNTQNPACSVQTSILLHEICRVKGLSISNLHCQNKHRSPSLPENYLAFVCAVLPMPISIAQSRPLQLGIKRLRRARQRGWISRTSGLMTSGLGT